MTILDIVLFLPLVGFLVLLMVPRGNPGASRMAALVISLLVFALSLGLLAPYWYQYPLGQTFTTDVPWIDYPPIRYHVGLDGLSLWLVLLSTLLTPIAVLISWNHIDHRVKEFFAFLILLEFGLIGVFVAVDLFLFYVAVPSLPDTVANGFRWLYTPIYNKYFVDEFYDATVVRPTVDGSRTLLWRTVDAGLIDGAVNGIGQDARLLGGVLKLAQSGFIRNYAAWVVAGSILVVVAMGMMGGAR